jgi:hypothetical protein
MIRLPGQTIAGEDMQKSSQSVNSVITQTLSSYQAALRGR